MKLLELLVYLNTVAERSSDILQSRRTKVGTTNAAILVENLTKTYPNKVRALNGLNIAVPSATIVALLGPNGAGKSTTVKILTTLSRPDSGTAVVGGFDVVRNPHRVRQTIGCVAQKSGVDRESTGRENLMLQARFHNMPRAELRGRVDDLLNRFQLSAAANRVARTYSGGMQRKLDIAMGLIHRPQVLFLDEPTTGLDPEARASLWNEIARLRDEGLTILLTTHYLEEADRLADHVAIVDTGRVVAEGAPDKLKAELRGDSIQIDLIEPATLPAIEAALSNLISVENLQLHERTLHARAANGASAAPAILSALESAQIRVASVKIARPTLDDVYLRHTGRTMQEAEEGQQNEIAR